MNRTEPRTDSRTEAGYAEPLTSTPSLSEAYARYFFSVFDACLHQDEAGRRLATQHLEESLSLCQGARPESAAFPR